MKKRNSQAQNPARNEVTGLLKQAAYFRYELRKFLRFSEMAARRSGLTPQQHQLMLGVAGHTGRGEASIGELSEFLQERHNAVVGLVQRAQRAGWVVKTADPNDRRRMQVRLTPSGRRRLRQLTWQHRRELKRLSQLLRQFQTS